jgi:hypothetical protein
MTYDNSKPLSHAGKAHNAIDVALWETGDMISDLVRGAANADNTETLKFLADLRGDLFRIRDAIVARFDFYET